LNLQTKIFCYSAFIILTAVGTYFWYVTAVGYGIRFALSPFGILGLPFLYVVLNEEKKELEKSKKIQTVIAWIVLSSCIVMISFMLGMILGALLGILVFMNYSDDIQIRYLSWISAITAMIMAYFYFSVFFGGVFGVMSSWRKIFMGCLVGVLGFTLGKGVFETGIFDQSALAYPMTIVFTGVACAMIYLYEYREEKPKPAFSPLTK
jgi:hypothetical protein